jgi:hypothetical protein
MKSLDKIIGLQADEEIVQVVKHYFLIIVPHLIIGFLILLLDFFLLFYFITLGWWGWIIFSLIIFLVGFYMFRLVFLWNRNLIIVTNKRLIDYERSSFFNQLISDFPYPKIKNITGQRKGFWQTVFGFGDLRIDLTDRNQPFELYNLYQPFKLLELINEKINKRQITTSEAAEEQIGEIINKIQALPDEQKKIALERITVNFSQKNE